MEQNVRLHIGKHNKHVLINKASVSNLRSFKLRTTPALITTWEIVGNDFKYNEPPNNIFSNESYPLRVVIGKEKAYIILLSRPLSMLKNIEIDLHAEHKDTIRIVSCIPLHQDIIDTLVDLGVEVEIQPLTEEKL
ncbi:MAG: hypothetical protein PVI90_00035 [Desulfobacteraceae bacterium]|jgi:hypothetical protein